MNLLVTGGLGHIGSKLIRSYSSRDDINTIRILDNLYVQRYVSLFNLPELEKNKFEFIEGDVRNLEDCQRAVKDIDVVIHLAALTDAPSTIDNKEETFSVNLEGTKNMLKASAQAGVKKFIFPSTTSVYGEATGIVDELSELRPASPYAESKIAAEKEVQLAHKELGLNTNVLRMGTIFGTSVGMRFHTAVNKFCYLASLGMPLTVWDSALESKRPYLELDDNISAFQFIEKNGSPGELYNVLTSNYQMSEILDSIKKVYPDLKIEITKSPILNQKPYHVSDDKIRALGFTPKGNLDNAVNETISLFKAINSP